MLRLCAGSELRVLASIECAKQRIRLIIAGSHVPEDPCHADNTVEWLLRLEPDASETLQLAALAHDICLLYTSDAADDLLCVDLGGRRIIKKKKKTTTNTKK